jgi:hypothetical protein
MPIASKLAENSLDKLLTRAAVSVCKNQAIDFAGLPLEQRIFITHYRCAMCRLQPLYLLDLHNPRMPKCGRCGFVVSLRAVGTKYGKTRKTIALILKDNHIKRASKN